MTNYYYSNNQSDVFVCFDLMSFNAIDAAIEWLPKILRRFKKGFGGCFIAATHYDDFEEKDPSFKSSFQKANYKAIMGIHLISILIIIDKLAPQIFSK